MSPNTTHNPVSVGSPTPRRPPLPRDFLSQQDTKWNPSLTTRPSPPRSRPQSFRGTTGYSLRRSLISTRPTPSLPETTTPRPTATGTPSESLEHDSVLPDRDSISLRGTPSTPTSSGCLNSDTYPGGRSRRPERGQNLLNSPMGPPGLLREVTRLYGVRRETTDHTVNSHQRDDACLPGVRVRRRE